MFLPSSLGIWWAMCTGVNVPKYISDATHNTRELTLSSAPLPMPNNECPFSVAKVIN